MRPSFGFDRKQGSHGNKNRLIYLKQKSNFVIFLGNIMKTSFRLSLILNLNRCNSQQSFGNDDSKIVIMDRPAGVFFGLLINLLTLQIS